MSQAPAQTPPQKAPPGTPPGTPRPAAPNVPPMAGGEPPVTPQATPPATQQEPPTPAPATPPVAPEPMKIDATLTEQISTMVTDAGLDPKEVASIMAKDGMTPAIMKALTEKHGEGVASLLAAQMNAVVGAGKDQATARDQEIYKQLEETFKDMTEQSGSETWRELKGWAKENIPEADRAEINKLLNQGGIGAKLAIQELSTMFKNSSGYEQPAGLVTGDGLAATGTGKPISKQEYHAELNALLDKGHVYGQSNEIAQLDARRMKSIQRGNK